MTIRRCLCVLGLSLPVAGLLLGLAVAVNHRYASPAKPQARTAHSDRRIFVIGDSWVAGKALDAPIKLALLSRGNSADIESHGHPGERTGPIYGHLAGIAISADSCVIVAGINDAIGHFGTEYYVHHMRLIVEAVRAQDCAPVVVELPRFDQAATVAASAVQLRARSYLYGILFDHTSSDLVRSYREQLSAGLGSSVKLLNPDPIIGSPSSRPTLWANPSHLSVAGKIALGEGIARLISWK